MIYGQFAKDYANSQSRGGANFKVVSESDAIIDCLLNEMNQYENTVFTESFVSAEERMVAEAKLEAITEAVGAAIIAAIIALIGALIALIAKVVSMIKKGAAQIKGEFGSFGSELTPEQEKEALQKIRQLSSNLNYSNKDKLVGLCPYSTIDNGTIIGNGKAVFEELLQIAKSIVSTATGSGSSDDLLKHIEPEYDKLKKTDNELSNIKNSSENLFFDTFIQNGMKSSKMAGYAAAMLKEGYFDKVTKVENEVNSKAEDLKNYLDNNSRKTLAKLHPDNHRDDSAGFTKVMQAVNGSFICMKSIISSYKTFTSWLAEAERWRLGVCKILASYVK